MIILYPLPELLPDSRARFIQTLNTCHALAEQGCEVRILTGLSRGYTARDIPGFYGLPDNKNLKIISLPMLRREHAGVLRWSWHGIFDYSFLLYLLLFRSTFKNQAVLFVRHLKLAHFLLRRSNLHRLPLLFESHEIFSKDKVAGALRKTLAMEKIVYCLSDAFVFISGKLQDAVELIMPGTRARPSIVAHDGVRNEWLANRPESDRKYICYAGSLYKWKGVDILISAMEHLPKEMLLIIGGGSRLDELKDEVGRRGLKNINFAGNVPHHLIPEFYSQAKVAVLPNIESGPSPFSSPLKLFEYMACGIPIVASDMPVFREVLEHGENALLAEPGNPSSLAAAIRILLENPSFARDIAEQAKKDSGEFTYDKRAEKILGLCERTLLLRGKAGAGRKGVEGSPCT